MEPRMALKDGFEYWLSEITSPKKMPHRPFYPFATSRRSTAVMYPLLDRTNTGQPLGVNDTTQAVTDLRNALLVKGSFPNHSIAKLGAATLALWCDLGIANSESSDEVARWASLIRLGVELGERFYVDAFQFWCRLTALAPSTYWFSDLYTLVMPVYLDQEDTNGYNPFRVLTAVNDGEIGSEPQWREWEQSNQGNNLGSGIAQLLHRVRESYRYPDCLAYCRGMEAYRIVQAEPESLHDVLKSWGMSQ